MVEKIGKLHSKYTRELIMPASVKEYHTVGRKRSDKCEQIYKQGERGRAKEREREKERGREGERERRRQREGGREGRRGTVVKRDRGTE